MASFAGLFFLLHVLRPDGTSERCESKVPIPRPRPEDAPPPVPIPKTVLYHEPGGYLRTYELKWQALALSGDDVEIRGSCASACTLIMAHIPKDRLCFGLSGREPQRIAVSILQGRREGRCVAHSITSSARASNVGGTSKPIALAVFRLITSSNLVGACTGRSPALAPLRMRST